eukprot:s151_g7.t1
MWSIVVESQCRSLTPQAPQVNMAGVVQGFRHRHAELVLSFLCFLWWKPPMHFVHIFHASNGGRGVPRRAADFESGLSLEDMLQLAEERAKNAKTSGTTKTTNAKRPDTAASVPSVPSVPLVAVPGNTEMEVEEIEAIDETDGDDGDLQKETPEVLIPEVLNRIPSFGRQRLEEAAVLPCVFSPTEQGERPIGVEVELRFWEPAYQMLWQYAQKRTAGAVAVRFSKGSLRRSPDVFALWPAEMKDGSLRGLNMGMYNLSVKTVHPFPVIRLMQLPGVDEADGQDPQELHDHLRSLESREQQSDALHAMSPADRLALLRWMANGGNGPMT